MWATTVIASKFDDQQKKGEEKQKNTLNMGHNQALRVGHNQ